MPNIAGWIADERAAKRENIRPNDTLSARKELNVTLLPRRNFTRVIVHRNKRF
jgi:hypothetical protein